VKILKNLRNDLVKLRNLSIEKMGNIRNSPVLEKTHRFLYSNTECNAAGQRARGEQYYEMPEILRFQTTMLFLDPYRMAFHAVVFFGLGFEFLFELGLITDYGHTMAEFLILCSPNSNPK
jgi:hypothetical protein